MQWKGLLKLSFRLRVPEELRKAFVTIVRKLKPCKTVRLCSGKLAGEDDLYEFTVYLSALELNECIELRVFDGQRNAAALRDAAGTMLEDNVLKYSVRNHIGELLKKPF